MLCLKDYSLIAGRMSAIDASVRPRPESFEPDAKFAADEITYEIFKIGR
jgi:hypothetical protein